MSPNKLTLGKLDRRITIEEFTQTQDPEYGSKIETWATWRTVYANFYTGGGREFEAARQINAETSAQFQIKYVDGINTKMRVLYQGAYYEILWIQEVGRRDRLNLWTKART